MRDFFEAEGSILNRDDPADGLGSLLASSGALPGSEPGRPLTAQDILDAMELIRLSPPIEARPYIVHPTAGLHLEQHGGGDPACEECVTIWMNAELTRGIG